VSIPLQIVIGLVLVLGALVLGVHLFHETPPPVPRPLPPRATPSRQPEDPRTVLKAEAIERDKAAIASIERSVILNDGRVLRVPPPPPAPLVNLHPGPPTHVLRISGKGILEKVTIEQDAAERAQAERERQANQKKLLL